ncbi:unnamed protein product [Calypogeia fissa]
MEDQVAWSSMLNQHHSDGIDRGIVLTDLSTMAATAAIAKRYLPPYHDRIGTTLSASASKALLCPVVWYRFQHGHRINLMREDINNLANLAKNSAAKIYQYRIDIVMPGFYA